MLFQNGCVMFFQNMEIRGMFLSEPENPLLMSLLVPDLQNLEKWFLTKGRHE